MFLAMYWSFGSGQSTAQNDLHMENVASKHGKRIGLSPGPSMVTLRFRIDSVDRLGIWRDAVAILPSLFGGGEK